MTHLSALAMQLAIRHRELKLIVEQYTGLDRDALHIHIALLLYLATALLFRQSRSSRLPWLVVFAFEIGNEAWDLLRNFNEVRPVYGPDAFYLLEWRESVKDLWNTMLWPTVLLLVGRYTNLFERRSDADSKVKSEPVTNAPQPYGAER